VANDLGRLRSAYRRATRQDDAITDTILNQHTNTDEDTFIMIAPALPHDEQERLHDLRTIGLLDSPSEERFDRIVRLATRTLNVPIAYISFVDENRQWLKTKDQFQPCKMSWEEMETPRDTSFCGHTILQQEPLLIEDATADPRFRENPMVINEPNIRFYAGHPLKGPMGQNIATLCLLDNEPRTLSEHEYEAFVEMAGLAQRELSLVNIIEIQDRLISMQDALKLTQKQLAHELTGAANYVLNLIPPPITDGKLQIDWRFIASSKVGGDLMGYHWLDDDHLATYLLDVSGHGVDASLHSASVYQALRSQSLPVADWADPAAVLTALNTAFPMAKNANKFVTAWYSVYTVSTGTLDYATAGHHPALLLPPRSASQEDGEEETLAIRALGEPSFMIGVTDEPDYSQQQTSVEPGSRLYIFSDAAFEVRAKESPHPLMNFDGLQERMASMPFKEGGRLDCILESIRSYQGQPTFGDDFSMLELVFDA